MSSPIDDATPYRGPEETPTVAMDAEPADPAQFPPGTILGGRYRIVSLIGRGGMGAVYRGDDLRVGQPIAMKFLRRTSDARERMLYDEIRIGRQVSHPNVCRLHDIVEVDGQIFITMELVDGEDLASLLRRIGRLPQDKASSVARDLCAGLAAAHEMGVIHRDLKPGNIMIDGRGRARITDFGLAIPDTSRDHLSAGTPAYMAPEQFAGAAATAQSDIYALGLVLYELFTGRRVFSASSVAEIVAQHKNTTITRPSEVVRDIEPAVERAILHCLDPDPARRPQSVHELLRELPSFDALAAALAAGQTPSPAMVAAASERGDLHARAAWPLCAVVLASIAGCVLLAGRTLAVNSMGEIKAPAVLLERVRELLAAADVPAPPRDVAWLFLPDRLSGGEYPVQFVYRQSPRPMPSSQFDEVVTENDPPLTVSGMALVRMQPSGRLVELAVVPPQREPAPPPRQPDFAEMFAQAGVDRASLVAVKSEWAAPVHSDVKYAWLVSGTPWRVEAASYHGRPVWFALISPRTPSWRMTDPVTPLPERIALGTAVAVAIVVPIATVFIGIRNLRRGQGDRRGATRVAAVVFLGLFGGGLIRAHHVPDLYGEWLMVSMMAAQMTFWAMAFWMAYVAIEPLIRKRWPNILVSWSRLLEGRWRDPMVGRDLLIGAAMGATFGLTVYATHLMAGERMSTSISPLGSIRHTIYLLTFTGAVESIGRALFGAVILVLLRAVLRNMSLVTTVAVTISALGVADLPGGPVTVRIAWALAASAVAWFVFMRVGLLAIASASFTILTLIRMPITGDPDAWYFGTSMLTLAPLVALSIFGFSTSLGGKSPFPHFALEE